jgi:hypothetical protein
MALIAIGLSIFEVLEASTVAEISWESSLIFDALVTTVVAGVATASVAAASLGSNRRNLGTFDTPSAPSKDPDDVGTPMDFHIAFESPLCTPDTIMAPLNKRLTTPIENPAQGVERDQKLRRKGPGSRTQVVYEGPEYVSDLCRDFSGIQRTVVNPITGRIIGYKGIRSRKRKLDLVRKYSSFWRDYDRAKSSFRAARSPGIWDSARR